MSIDVKSETISKSQPFDVAGYLEERRSSESFVLVELGHREKPIVSRQSNLTNQRTYIGIELWLRDPTGVVRSMIATKLGQELVGQNAFFIDNPTECRPIYEDERPSREYEGEYDPRTILPDGAADEIFLGNVFGDPHISLRKGNVKKLLEETTRLAATTGKIVIRETITPYLTTSLNDPLISDVGLTRLGSYSMSEDIEDWNELEAVFNGGDNFRLDPGSYYTILGRS